MVASLLLFLPLLLYVGVLFLGGGFSVASVASCAASVVASRRWM